MDPENYNIKNYLETLTMPENWFPIGQSFDRVGIDLVRLLPITTQGNCYIAVAVDYLTKWSKARAIQKADAKLVANFHL
ncbi:hypothetical protein G9A89_001215 [Geosiphon pyriformis]|nr:hypothetical protein G9A89_001215 [Geosiphon pyriformis]